MADQNELFAQMDELLRVAAEQLSKDNAMSNGDALAALSLRSIDALMDIAPDDVPDMVNTRIRLDMAKVQQTASKMGRAVDLHNSAVMRFREAAQARFRREN